LAFTGIGATAAGAKTAPASFVGSYKVHLLIDGTRAGGGKLELEADGTALLGPKAIAHWTSNGSKITILYKAVQHHVHGVEKFVGTQSASGIGTKQDPGTFTVTVEGTSFSGNWYAVKIA
jgi:hypothetical protein